MVMQQFADEFREAWTKQKPDLVVADFVSPVAGFVAEELGIPWWTSMPCLTFLEAKTGPPPFVGGLQPSKNIFGRCRNYLARQFVLMFKRIVVIIYGRAFRKLGFKSLHRADGTESYYSGDVILGMGIKELEFETAGQHLMRWMGPCVESPAVEHTPPIYEQGKKHIFISLGTQIPWAKKRTKTVFAEVARQLPEFVFHFVQGKIDEVKLQLEGNLHYYSYIPYTTESLQKYAVIINHCGSGIMYASIFAGVPQLNWAQDFDQHDNAARVEYHGLGLRTNGKVEDVVRKLKKLLDDSSYRTRTAEFQKIAQRYTPGETFLQLIEERFG
jgi:UDP:flavonoid glycosyltransferase YjiC (YdhE family)